MRTCVVQRGASHDGGFAAMAACVDWLREGCGAASSAVSTLTQDRAKNPGPMVKVKQAPGEQADIAGGNHGRARPTRVAGRYWDRCYHSPCRRSRLARRTDPRRYRY